MSAVTHADVVAAARGWLGTPFQHQQRFKGLACDCAGLLIGVARELGLVAADFDVPAYPRVPDGLSLLRWCDEYMTRVDREQLQPGQVIAVVIDAEPQHLGIVGDYRHGGLSLIHAAARVPNGRGRVIETRLMFSRVQRFAAAWALPGVA